MSSSEPSKKRRPSKSERTKRDEEIIKDRADRLTIAVIAKRHGLSNTRVWSILNNHSRMSSSEETKCCRIVGSLVCDMPYPHGGLHVSKDGVVFTDREIVIRPDPREAMCTAPDCDWPALQQTIVEPRCSRHYTPDRVPELLRRINHAIEASDNDGGSASDAIQDMLAILRGEE